MSFAKWPGDDPLASVAARDPAARPTAPANPGADAHSNPYTSLLLGMIHRLDEPDRGQWFRMVLGLTATSVEADRAVLVSHDDAGTLRVLSTFGAHPGQDPLARTRASVETSVRSRDPLLVGFGSARSPSVICIPVVREQRIRGVLVLESERAAFRPGDVTLARAVARRLADSVAAEHRQRSEGEAAAVTQYGNLLSCSDQMREIFELIDKIAVTDHPVIVQGESGTGKELVARAIHFNGLRRERPFIAENCAAISESLLEAELFGYVKGAFTGADSDRKGFFELADGGTLFLDEIGEMNEKMQKDLLRVLQEGEVRPVGGKRVIKVDVRIICASNRNLQAMVEHNQFRKDFFYRLNVMTVDLPPLRDRAEDIPLLIDRFLDAIARDTGMPKKRIGPGVLEALAAYDWPGNIRELKNEMKRMVALARGDSIAVSELRTRPSGGPTVGDRAARGCRDFPSLAELEREHVLEALRRTKGNKARAAQLLGVNKATVFRKLKSYGSAS